MQTVDIINTDSTSVACCGGEAPFDHPRVYLEIVPEEGRVTCPYCSRQFVLE